jgi:hypothetical protein
MVIFFLIFWRFASLKLVKTSQDNVFEPPTHPIRQYDVLRQREYGYDEPFRFIFMIYCSCHAVKSGCSLLKQFTNQQIFNLSACNVVMQYLFCGTEYCKVALIARKSTSGLTLCLSRVAQSCHCNLQINLQYCDAVFIL